MSAARYTNSEPGPSDFWAVTSLFNPAGYPSRLDNYHIFRKRLNVPLICVELAFGETPFQLDESAADILIQLRGGDVMWQKERLLNIGLSSLPPECKYVAWLDCDIVFQEPDWTTRAKQALQTHRLIQPFHHFRELLPGESGTHRHLQAAAAVLEDPAVADRIFNGCGVSEANGSVPGFAWATHRDLIEQVGLYDRLILGSGDKAFLSAAYGRGRDFLRAYQFDEARWSGYLAWCEALSSLFSDRIGFIDGVAYHLAHGRVTNKQWGNRHRGMDQFEYDPQRDITLNEYGCWTWDSDKRDMHAYVVNYFLNRREEEFAGPPAGWCAREGCHLDGHA